MEFWVDIDRAELGKSLVEEIESLTGVKHPPIDSVESMPFIFKQLKAKNWTWNIECFENSYTMVIYPGNDNIRCFAQDIDMIRTIYLAYYDALIYDLN